MDTKQERVRSKLPAEAKWPSFQGTFTCIEVDGCTRVLTLVSQTLVSLRGKATGNEKFPVLIKNPHSLQLRERHIFPE